MRVRRGAVLSLVVLGISARAFALEKQKQTTSAPAAQAAPTEQAPPPPRPTQWYLLEDKGYFLPPLADPTPPTNYMRVYIAPPVAYGTNVGNRHHVYWDVGFGEEFFIFGRNYLAADGTPIAKDVRWPTGWALFIDADMHMLLDFNGYSHPVIDSEFHLGGGLMGRGLPGTAPETLLSHLSWRLKLFHESTHIGDEYLDDIRRRQQAPQGGDPSTAGFIHPNISYMALELLLAIDGEFWPHQVTLPDEPAKTPDDRPQCRLPDECKPADTCRRPLPDECKPKLTRYKAYWRVYGGVRRLSNSPYDTGVPFAGLDPGLVITNPGPRNEAQAGLELRYRITPFLAQGWRRPDYFIAASDVAFRKQYDYFGTNPDPRWWSANVIAGFEWGDWTDEQMTFRVFASYYNGLNPHGQFRNETLSYGGLTIQIDY
jgi:hypothetical protein